MLAAALALSLVAPAPTASADPAIVRWQVSHRRTQLVGMGVLTGWALANIGGGVAGALTVRGEQRFFHQANAAWNTVNLTLGVIGLANAGRRLPPAQSLTDARATTRKTKRVYLINALLDLGYIAAGTLMSALGQRYRSDRVQRYGDAVSLQGAWLFGFDVAMMIAHDRVPRGR